MPDNYRRNLNVLMSTGMICAVLGAHVAAEPPKPAGSTAPPSVSKLPQDRVKEILPEETKFKDASLDGWDSEVLSSGADGVLKHFVEWIASGRVTPDELKEYVVADYAGDALRPAKLKPAFSESGLVVSRADGPPAQVKGLDGLAADVERLAAPFSGHQNTDDPLYVKFKTVGVDILSADTAAIEVIYLAGGKAASGAVQQNGYWNTQWDISAGLKTPRLREIRVGRFDEITHKAPLYSDCTKAVIGRTPAFEYLRFGVDHWWTRIDTATGLYHYGHYGLALGDVNNDGLDDVYVPLPGGLPNVLYRHEPDGTVTEISADSGANFSNDTPSALIIDLDNDGFQDLVLGMLHSTLLLRGDGTGRFQQTSALSTTMPTSLSAVDFDADGDLDIYITCYSAGGILRDVSGSMIDSSTGKANELWRNDGGWTFTNVTRLCGIDHNNNKYSFAAQWSDYDNDGDPDCYVANDFGRDNLYRNDNGQFRDVALESGVVEQGAGMGVTWADYDQDGLMDLYVSNMFSSAGLRITGQKSKFRPDEDPNELKLFRHFARGNTLFRNRGDGAFDDLSDQAGVTMGRWAWGAQFVDFNNDGREDIVVPNGMVTNEKTEDL